MGPFENLNGHPIYGPQKLSILAFSYMDPPKWKYIDPQVQIYGPPVQIYGPPAGNIHMDPQLYGPLIGPFQNPLNGPPVYMDPQRLLVRFLNFERAPTKIHCFHKIWNAIFSFLLDKPTPLNCRLGDAHACEMLAPARAGTSSGEGCERQDIPP